MAPQGHPAHSEAPQEERWADEYLQGTCPGGGAGGPHSSWPPPLWQPREPANLSIEHQAGWVLTSEVACGVGTETRLPRATQAAEPRQHLDPG